MTRTNAAKKRPLPRKGATAAKAKRSATALSVVKLATPKNLLEIVRDVMRDPNSDPAKARMSLDLLRDVEAGEAKKSFTRAFMALQRDLPSINQDSKIEVREKNRATGERSGKVLQSTPFATFNNIMKTVKPLLQAHGFALSFSTEPVPDGSRLIVIGILEHIDGHQRTTSFPLPAETSGSKNNVQGWGSSMSYGKRYCTIALLNIVSGAPRDADTDGAGPKVPKSVGAIDGEVVVEEAVVVVSQEQHDKLVEAIEACGVGRKRFCEKYGIEKVAALPAEKFSDAMKACKDFAEQRRG